MQHSRLLDAAPVAAPVLDNSRRLSRLPPGFSMLDPFGFNLTNDASPYDLALSASQADLAAGITSAARSSVRASYLGSPAVSTTPSLSPYPSTSSTSSLPSTPSLSSPPDGSFAPGAQPWLKPRASSAGEQGMGHNRSHVRNGLLAPNGYASPRQANGRSKLSGEIDADVRSPPPCHSFRGEADSAAALSHRPCRSRRPRNDSRSRKSPVSPPTPTTSTRSSTSALSRRRRRSRRSAPRRPPRARSRGTTRPARRASRPVRSRPRSAALAGSAGCADAVARARGRRASCLRRACQGRRRPGEEAGRDWAGSVRAARRRSGSASRPRRLKATSKARSRRARARLRSRCRLDGTGAAAAVLAWACRRTASRPPRRCRRARICRARRRCARWASRRTS